MNILMRTRFGSHLYGTDTPSSDTDYKGVYLPSVREVFLNRIPKSVRANTGNDLQKNAANDIDDEIYSLHYFIKLAIKGETAALDMLHAPLDFLESYTDEWEFIFNNREKFYTKSLKAFIGYARRQASKYGIKGSRLAVMREVVELLENDRSALTTRMELIWDYLPVTEHSRFIDDSPNGIKQYELCGRIYQASSLISYCHENIKKMYNCYGERAEQAERNEGIDWKSISHAIRAAYQVKELFEHKTITFPRPEAEFLKAVKTGKMHYKNEVSPILENLMDEVDRLSLTSDLPTQPDTLFWEDFIFDACRRQIINGF